mmetsp:Transcript_9016/g.11738  ORF Transcript_9016/g.11738 Transcript_9016/m.11738 type:complete len:80 (-) Transcript_9016:327-566(-)
MSFSVFQIYRIVLNCDTSTVAKFVFHGVNGSMTTGLEDPRFPPLPSSFIGCFSDDMELVVAAAAAATAVSVRRGPNNFT